MLQAPISIKQDAFLIPCVRSVQAADSVVPLKRDAWKMAEEWNILKKQRKNTRVSRKLQGRDCESPRPREADLPLPKLGASASLPELWSSPALDMKVRLEFEPSKNFESVSAFSALFYLFYLCYLCFDLGRRFDKKPPRFSGRRGKVWWTDRGRAFVAETF